MKRSLTQRLLERIDPASFYSRYTELKPIAGKRESKGLCPLHQEKTPSFFVNVATGAFKCFGCGAGGGPIQFYAALRGVSVSQARAELAQELGLAGNGGNGRQGVQAAGRSGGTPPRRVSQNPSVDTEIYASLLAAGRPLGEDALAYFARRRIRPETLERFQVSYLARPAHVAGELLASFGRNKLLAAGVLREMESGELLFQFQRHPLLFPILKDGQPVFIQGRGFRDGKSRVKYCNLANVPVPALFNIDELKRLASGTPVFVCEGAPDTLALAQEGFQAVGIIGSSGFKEEWVSDVAPFRVYLVLDNDSAGEKGTEKIRRLFHEKHLPVFVVKLPEGVKDVNDFFLTNSGEDFQRLVSRAQEHEVDLRSAVQLLLEGSRNGSRGFSYRQIARQVYSWFETHGGVFAVDKEGRCLLMFDRTLYQIDNNSTFNALMFARTDLVAVEQPGKVVWELLRNLCVLRGKKESNLSWIHTDQERGRIYINLHNSANQILRLEAGDTTLLANGNNEDGVLLKTSDKMEGIDFDAKANPRQAVEFLKQLVMEPLACEPENRLFICCWILTAFFLDYTTDKALLKLSGSTGSGKTTAARILSCLLYGADRVESATVPYYYADASRNPYLICDNLETENMNRDITQFLLHVATGISKGKRKTGTDSEVVRESANALVAITAIEPLTRSELINRTYDVEFRSVFKHAGFMQKEHLAELVRRRNQILSGLFILFSRQVLPGLRSHRQDILATIEQQHPHHSKERVDSFLTLMVVILKALLSVLEPGKQCAWEIVRYWIEYQNRLAQETERDTNMAVYLLDGLAKEMMARGEEFRRDYYLDFSTVMNGEREPAEIHFVASSRDLLMALQVLSKNKGFKLPFSNTKQLGVRLANESGVLEKAGWSWERERIVNGMRYQRFRKRLG